MTRIVTLLDRVSLVLATTAAAIAAAILAALFVVIQYEVVLRFVFNSPTSWTNEVSTFAISWVGFLGAAYVLRIGRHLEVDVLTTRISFPARRLLGTVTDLIGCGFCVFTAFLGKRFVDIAILMRASSASELDTPLWIPYLAIPIGFSLLALEFLVRALSRWSLVSGRDPDPHGGVID